MKMMELMELNIIAVERIDNTRQKYPKHHAIYFISPYLESIDLLIADYPNKKGENNYGKVHIFLTNRIEDNLMSKIAANKNLIDRILTFKEFN